MRILYSAIDQTVPGTKGGSIHVAAVAEGLAALGHDVTVLVTPGRQAPRPSSVRWIPLPPPFGSTHLRLARTRAVADVARRLRPDVIMERYHNFGGEAIRLAKRFRATAVLEVNAPMIDHHGSTKALIDKGVLVQPMRRWREHLARSADIIVTPLAEIVPAEVPREKIVVLEWGADTDRFRPGAAGDLPFDRPRVPTVAVFAGAFRSWHGAIHLVRAIKALRGRGRTDIGAVLIGDGPELPSVRGEAAGLEHVVLTGALPHDVMPAALAAADIGVAPFDIAVHGPLALGFYWSPLKLFEYMASGLPVVVPAVGRMPSLVEHGREGLLYDPGSSGALADALEQLADPALRRALGTAARARAEQQYGWSAHCRTLERAIIRART